MKAKVLFILPLVLLLGLPAMASGGKKDDMNSKSEPKTPEHVPSQLLVAFKEDTKAEDIQSVFDRHSLKKLDKVGPTALYLVAVPEGKDLKEVQKELKAEPQVRYSELNGVMKTFKQGF
jgi:hypothetical protein